MRHGINDQAHEHFSAAVKLDAKDAASWDGLARIWRDWGFPHLALPDASSRRLLRPGFTGRAQHARHGAAGARPSRRGACAVREGVALDATAAYALTNLCYGWALEGNAAKAATACQQALHLEPDMEAARNNLAVAYEASGDSTAALAVLAASGDAARTDYNTGILHLAASPLSRGAASVR